ncbi:diguanylate cyclase [bacterium]|nr:diguanylate cyclase [bacterium]
MFKKLLNSKYSSVYLTYILSFTLTVLSIILLLRVPQVANLVENIENSTFDMRQNLIASSGYKKTNKDIVILTVDEASYEYLLGKYGEWPIPRNVYANVINYVEKSNPYAVAFDLMFVKSMKSSLNEDSTLINTMNKYNNIYTSLNFDQQPLDVRKPVALPEKLSVNLKNSSKNNFLENMSFSNCRAILTKIMTGNAKVGMINASRETDGILREIPPFATYQKKVYPHMALKVAVDYLNQKENTNISNKNFYVNGKSKLIIGKRHIPITGDGGAILNWYANRDNDFTKVPFYKVVKAADGEKGAKQYDFRNKIVYVGVTAMSLFDTKSVPVDKIYPGVEIHATFINNLIDDNFIRKVSPLTDILLSFAIAIIIGFIVIKTESTFVALASSVGITLGYTVFAYYAMKFFNLWVSLVLPISVIALIFVSAYIIKYILKSRDFDLQYKLATTDGLTDLYNHRYFQEQMIMQIGNCRRYKTHFSLIMTDIDFFKKFNDTYGHQAGDAVLRGVAHTLKKNVRSTDIVCRYGGEEMTIILTNTDKDEAILTAQKICQAVSEKPFRLGADLEKNVTISLGVATFPQDAQTPDEIIAHADKGLYKAKENGRNQVGL